MVLLVLGQFGSVGLAGNSYRPQTPSSMRCQPSRSTPAACGISARRCVEFLLKKLLRSGDTLIPQGLLAGVLLWLGWQAQRIGWNVWGLGIAASCYCLFYLGVVLHRVQHPHGPARGALCCAGAFVVLLVLGQFGSVGLAGNSWPGSRRAMALGRCRARADAGKQPCGISASPLRRVFVENCCAAAIR